MYVETQHMLLLKHPNLIALLNIANIVHISNFVEKKFIV